jgi:hypothetical protein
VRKPITVYKERQLSKFVVFFMRFMIPSCILALLGLGFFQFSQYLKENSLTQKAGQQKKSPYSTPLVSGPLPTTASTASENLSALPQGQPKATEPKDDKKDEFNPQDAEIQGGLTATRIVEQFLIAKTFEERMLYVTTQKNVEDLQNTILSRKWPTAQITPGSQINHLNERLTEYYFEVRFGENSINFPRKTTMLVHQRGNDDPKIVLEPLLDTVGDRLREFAKAPSSEPQDFYVIMDARIKCFDDKIPNSDKKCTFFLRAHINDEHIATAYASEISETRKQFDNPLNGLKWKDPIPVRVTLQWNTSEDYTRPFLELIEIKEKSWRN